MYFFAPFKFARSNFFTFSVLLYEVPDYEIFLRCFWTCCDNLFVLGYFSRKVCAFNFIKIMILCLPAVLNAIFSLLFINYSIIPLYGRLDEFQSLSLRCGEGQYLPCGELNHGRPYRNLIALELWITADKGRDIGNSEKMIYNCLLGKYVIFNVHSHVREIYLMQCTWCIC
jgi:hypothetical protein